MERSRFWWFGGNSFYATTTVSVFSFINEAKTKLEKCLWYFLLLFFLGVTVYNVVNFTQLFLSKPTKTFARVATNIEDLTLPNFTISLTLPLDIFANDLPFVVPELIKDTICANAAAGVVQKRIKEQERQVLAGKDLNSEHLGLLVKEFKNVAYPSSQTYADITYSLWDKSAAMRDILTTYRDTAFISWNRIQLKRQAEQLRESLSTIEPKQGYGNVLLALLTLQNRLQNQNQNDASKMGSRHLLETTHKVLNEFFLLKTNEVNEATFFLRDWSLDSDTRRQTFTFHVGLNGSKNQVVINIYLLKLARYFTAMTRLIHHAEFLKSSWVLANPGDDLYSHYAYELFERCDQRKTSCEPHASHLWLGDSMGWFRYISDHILFVYDATEILLRSFESNAVRPFLKHYEDTTSITLDLFGNQIKLLPFHQNHVEIFPAGRFKSQTDDCTNGTVLDCIDNCIGELYIEKCKCYPWMLEYLYGRSGHAMCSAPCNNLQNSTHLCASNCHANHRCDAQTVTNRLSQFKIHHAKWLQFFGYEEKDYNKNKVLVQYLKYKEFKLDDSKPFSQVTIDLPSDSHYPVYTETYLLNFHMFLSQLSGIWEFWLGINITGMAHLLIYLFRQGYRALDPYSKTRQAWRNVFHPSKPLKKLELLDQIRRKNDRIMKHIKKSFKLEEGEPPRAIENEERHWLFRNNFFKETPLTGFFYIDNAKSKTEAFLWYIMLIVFLALTLQSISQSYNDFRQKPTTTKIGFDFSVQSMDNITLKLRMSWLEFQGRLPFIYSPTGNTFNYMAPQNLICEQAAPQYEQSKIDHLLSDITCALAKHYYKGELADALPENFYQGLCSQASPSTISLVDQIKDFLQINQPNRTSVVDQWKTVVAPHAMKQFQQFWAAHRKWEENVVTEIVVVDIDGENFGEAIETSSEPKMSAESLLNITDSMNSDIVARAQSQIIPLLMLFELIEANNVGEIYAKMVKNDVANFFDHLTFDFFISQILNTQQSGYTFSRTQWADYLLANPYHQKLVTHNVTLSSLIDLVNSLILNILPIQTEGTEAQAILQQATLMENKQVQLQYQITVSKDKNPDKIKFELYSFELMRYLTIMQSVMDHISVQKRKEALGVCSDYCRQELYCNKYGLWYLAPSNGGAEMEVPGDKIAQFIGFNQRDISGERDIFYGMEHVFIDHEKSIYAVYKRAISQVLKHYQQTTNIELSSTAAGVNHFEPFKHHQITVLPTSNFQSHKTECYTGTVNRCIQNCQLDAYIKHCACHPWHLHHMVYTEKYSQICSKSCLPAKAARERCTADCLEPCSIHLYRKQQLSTPIRHIQWATDGQFGFEKLIIDPLLPLASFEIQLQKFQHPKLTETYSITTSAFVAQLGNLMELWLGFNIVALMHMILFSVKKLANRFCVKKSKVSKVNEDTRKTDGNLSQDFDAIKLRHEKIVTEWKKARHGIRRIVGSTKTI